MGNEDRETTIAFTDADEDMQVYTANRKLKNRLHKLGFEAEEEDKLGEFFVIPRAFLQLRKPRDFDLTEEEREERVERLRAAREAAGIGEYGEGAKKGGKKTLTAAEKKKKAAKKKKKAAAAKAEAEAEAEDDEDDDDYEDEEEETEVVRPKGRTRPGDKKASKK